MKWYIKLFGIIPFLKKVIIEIKKPCVGTRRRRMWGAAYCRFSCHCLPFYLEVYFCFDTLHYVVFSRPLFNLVSRRYVLVVSRIRDTTLAWESGTLKKRPIWRIIVYTMLHVRGSQQSNIWTGWHYIQHLHASDVTECCWGCNMLQLHASCYSIFILQLKCPKHHIKREIKLHY